MIHWKRIEVEQPFSSLRLILLTFSIFVGNASLGFLSLFSSLSLVGSWYSRDVSENPSFWVSWRHSARMGSGALN